MTAFNTLHLDDEHQDGAGNRIRESSSDSLSSSSLDSVLSQRARVDVCRCCCNKESAGGADEQESMNSCSKFSFVCCHHALNSAKLPDNFMSKQEVLCFLNHELEQERIAAESAANEAISMILRLQVEKAALQMEARHYQELFEARTLYDEETISQLKDVVSSQEADRLVLEREIDECKQALHTFSESMQDKCRQVGFLGSNDSCKVSGITASAPSSMEEIDGGVSSSQVGNKNINSSTVKANIISISVHSAKDAQQMLVPSAEFKEEAKTKHVVSFSSSSPLNAGLRDFALGARVMSYGTCLDMIDRQLRRLEVEGDKMDRKENSFNDVIRESWLGILTQLSNLQQQIWSSGLSEIGAHGGLVKDGGCIVKHKDDVRPDSGPDISLCAACLQDAFHRKRFSPQSLDAGENELPSVLGSCLHVPGSESVVKGEGPSCVCSKYSKEFHQEENSILTYIDSWSDIIASIDSCLLNLEEKFATYQSRLHAFEVARRAMAEAVIMMNKNRMNVQKVLLKASILLKEFLSLTSLGCDILGIMHELVVDLTKASNLCEARCSDIDVGSEPKMNMGAVMQDNTLPSSNEGPEEVSIPSQVDLPQSPIGKLAFLWSSSLEWLSNEKCRAETAFSGWDYI